MSIMDRLSILLNISNIGGQIGHTLLNRLCYADNLCLISSKYVLDYSLT